MSQAADPAAPPPLIEEPTPPWRVFLDPRGRITRRTFWLHGVLALLGLGLLLGALLAIAGVRSPHAETVVELLLLWPALAVSIKRWHDRGRSGWWVLIVLVPYIGWLWALVENGFMPGTPGPNRYGPPPQ